MNYKLIILGIVVLMFSSSVFGLVLDLGTADSTTDSYGAWIGQSVQINESANINITVRFDPLGSVKPTYMTIWKILGSYDCSGVEDVCYEFVETAPVQNGNVYVFEETLQAGVYYDIVANATVSYSRAYGGTPTERTNNHLQINPLGGMVATTGGAVARTLYSNPQRYNIISITSTSQTPETKFELTALDPYNSVDITDFSAFIDNSTTTDTISTTNGTINWALNELINYTAYSSVYHPFKVYNTNTSANSQVTLYKHKLTYPENNYELTNAENITFQYNLTSDYNTFTSCKLYINDSLISTDSSLGIGVNDFFYEFTENGEYEWWVECNDTESRSRFITVTNVTGPSIISQTPTNTSLTYSEGDTIPFSVSVSSLINYVVTWFKDTVQQATGSVWNWITNGDDAGNYNITAVVEDSFGQTDTTEWNLTVLNVNLAPVVSTIAVSEDTIFANINYYVTCEITDSDTNSDDLIVEMAWGDGAFWYSETPYYTGSDIWRFNISAGTHSTDDVLSYRCRGTDNNTPALTSDWYSLPNYRTVGVEQTAPETPELLKPEYGQRKYTIPVLCAGAYDGQDASQRIYYELDVRKDLGLWENIRNQSGVMLYSYNIDGDAYDTMYDFRCRASDGIEYSAYITNLNATIKKNVPVFSILNVMDTPVYINGKPYQQGFFIDVSALGSDYSIYQVTAECNEDGIIDYSEQGFNRQTHKGVYTCINQAGTFKHTVNAYIYKNNTDEKWTQVCTDLEPTNQYCNIQKNYEVYIDE